MQSTFNGAFRHDPWRYDAEVVPGISIGIPIGVGPWTVVVVIALGGVVLLILAVLGVLAFGFGVSEIRSENWAKREVGRPLTERELQTWRDGKATLQEVIQAAKTANVGSPDNPLTR